MFLTSDLRRQSFCSSMGIICEWGCSQFHLSTLKMLLGLLKCWRLKILYWCPKVSDWLSCHTLRVTGQRSWAGLQMLRARAGEGVSGCRLVSPYAEQQLLSPITVQHSYCIGMGQNQVWVDWFVCVSRGMAMELRHLCELAPWWLKLVLHRSEAGNLHLWSGLDPSLNKMWLLEPDWLSMLFTGLYDV